MCYISENRNMSISEKYKLFYVISLNWHSPNIFMSDYYLWKVKVCAIVLDKIKIKLMGKNSKILFRVELIISILSLQWQIYHRFSF